MGGEDTGSPQTEGVGSSRNFVQLSSSSLASIVLVDDCGGGELAKRIGLSRSSLLFSSCLLPTIVLVDDRGWEELAAETLGFPSDLSLLRALPSVIVVGFAIDGMTTLGFSCRKYE
jgi:hypothetical protein